MKNVLMFIFCGYFFQRTSGERSCEYISLVESRVEGLSFIEMPRTVPC